MELMSGRYVAVHPHSAVASEQTANVLASMGVGILGQSNLKTLHVITAPSTGEHFHHTRRQFPKNRMTSIQKIDYALLPKKVKKQLRDALTNPQNIVYQLPTSAWRTYAASAFWVLVLLFLGWSILGNGFGDPLSDNGVQNKGFFITYCILGALTAYAVGAALNYRSLCDMFPFKPGLYLLPFTLIDARSAKLKVYDMVLLRQIEITIHRTNGRYTKTEFKMAFKDGKRHKLFVYNEAIATDLPVRWDALKSQAQAAHANRDGATVQGFDPFAELRNNNWQLKPSDASGGALWLRLLGSRVAVAAIVGSLCAVAVGLVRNFASDKAMYRAINEQKTEANYLGYIGNGWLKLREARAALPRVAFEEVRNKHSVTALRSLLRRYPAANLQDDVHAEIHALYQKAFALFQKQVPQANASLLPAMQRLMDFLEAKGDPNVQIHFSRPTTSALEDLDVKLKMRGGKYGNVIPAASHFTASSAATREARIAAALQVGFRATFPNDVLALQVNNSVNVAPPMLDIHYEIEPSGALYTEQNNSPAQAARQFVGLVARFKVALVVPDSADRWQFDLEVQPPETFTVNYKTQQGVATQGPQDSQVYACLLYTSDAADE